MTVQDPSTLTVVLAGIFSWAVLATASIIISGTLLAARFPLGFIREGKLSIPLGVFNMKAVRDQVILGFIAFIFALTCVIFFGGPAAYQFFRIQAGIDIGQWNSLCVISSALAMICSVIIFVIGSFIGRSSPVISGEERAGMIERLEELGHE